MKKELTAIICVILAVWFFFMGFEIGVYKERANNKVVVEQPTEVPTVPTAPSTEQPTVPPVTVPTAPAVTDPTVATDPTATSKPAKDDATKPTKKPAAAKDPSSMTKEQIIAEMAKAFKKIKAEQNVTAVKDEDVTINLTALSLERLRDTVNNIIQGLAETDHDTYTFVNGVATGVDKDGKDLGGDHTMASLLPPTDKEWNVDPAGVASAKAEKVGDNTVYTIVIVDEQTTYTEPIPKYSSQAFSFLDLTSINVPVAKITDASMHYPGTTVSVTVDASGKVLEIHYIMPMDGFGQASMLGLKGDANFEGKDDEKWTFTY